MKKKTEIEYIVNKIKNKKASKGDETDFRALLRHREHEKNKLLAEGMENVNLRHGLCLN